MSRLCLQQVACSIISKQLSVSNHSETLSEIKEALKEPKEVLTKQNETLNQQKEVLSKQNKTLSQHTEILIKQNEIIQILKKNGNNLGNQKLSYSQSGFQRKKLFFYQVDGIK